MHKCGLCRHAVSVRMSIRPSRSWILSKRVNISSKFFHHQVAKHSSFYIPNIVAVFWQEPLTWASNAGGVGTNQRYNWLSIDRSMTCWTCEQQVQQSTVQFTTQTATHQWCYIYHSLQHARPRRREEKRIYLYAAVNLKQNLGSMYCIIEATGRHETLHGLSATAGLLVFTVITVPENGYTRHCKIFKVGQPWHRNHSWY